MNQLTQDEKNAIHEAFRNDVVSRLKRLSQITTEDLLPLDRIGCVLIIDSAWEKCMRIPMKTDTRSDQK